jgi:hypothetical protein
VERFAAGWKDSALPLSDDCDDETPPFPLVTAVPGTATDGAPPDVALVLYRLLRAGSEEMGNGLTAVKGADGIELEY